MLAAPKRGVRVDLVVGLAAQTDGDRLFETLVRERFERAIDEFPTFATWLGIHDHDARLGDASREAKLRQMDEERAFLDGLRAIDPAGLSEAFRFERELAINASERAIFDDEVHRVWERRASASDDVGDGLFLLFARDFAPLSERLVSIAGRLEESPRVLREGRSRMGDAPVRLWNEMELESTTSLPSFIDEILTAARSEFEAGALELQRLEAASET